jgi:hypothetical protein
MARIIIALEVDDPELLDPNHESGLSEEGHLAISRALSPFGDIDDIAPEATGGV